MKKDKKRPGDDSVELDEALNENDFTDGTDETPEKDKSNSKKKSRSLGHKFVKSLITLMVILSVSLVAVACVKQFMIDKKPEQSELLPTGFQHEIVEKSPWDHFIDFLFGNNDTFDNDDVINGDNSDGKGSQGNLQNLQGTNQTPNSLPSNDGATSVKRKNEFYNFLILAKDKGGGNTDTIMILSFDVPNKTISLLQIPRDTSVNYNNSVRKINSVYSVGYRNSKGSTDEKTEKGIEALSTCLVQNFGIVIDRYVIMDLKGFREIVDTLGGVDVYVQSDMKYQDEYQNLDINLKKGMNHLDGKKAEDFVRFRKGYVNADLGRMDAQKIFMSAFLKKLFSVSTVTKVPELIGHIMEYVDTNATLQEATYFGTRLLDMDMSAITMHSLQGTSGSHTYYNGASYFSPYKNANIDLVNRYFNVFNKDLGPDNVNPKMIVKESGSGKYEGGQTAEQIDENNPTLSYVH